MTRRRLVGLGRVILSPLLWLAVYLSVALVLYGRDLHWQTETVGQSPSTPDQLSFVWYLGWWPWSLSHGLNPLVTKMNWYPSGYPLTWATSVPTAALLALPLTLAGAPIRAFNLLTVTAPALAAWFAYFLARGITRDEAASAIGGAIHGFSTYEAGQLLGHLNLDMTFLVPLMLLLCQQRATDQVSRPRFLVGLAVLFVLQFGLSTELTAGLVIVGMPALLVCSLLFQQPWSRMMQRLAWEAAIAGLLALATLAPWLVAMWRGAAEITGFNNSPMTYSIDLLNLIVPTQITWIGHSAHCLVTRFTGNQAEQGGYLGLPLISVLAVYGWLNRISASARALLLTLALVILASLGPTLWIAGRNTGISLPWRIVSELPILGGLLPCRVMVFAFLCAGVACAHWVTTAASRPARRIRLLACLGSALCLLPNPSVARWAPAPTLPFFAPAHISAALRERSNALVLPYNALGVGLLWQVQSGYRFTQSQCYFGFIPK